MALGKAAKAYQGQGLQSLVQSQGRSMASNTLVPSAVPGAQHGKQYHRCTVVQTHRSNALACADNERAVLPTCISKEQVLIGMCGGASQKLKRHSIRLLWCSSRTSQSAPRTVHSDMQCTAVSC